MLSIVKLIFVCVWFWAIYWSHRYLSIHPHLYLSTYLPMDLSIFFLSFYLSIYLSIIVNFQIIYIPGPRFGVVRIVVNHWNPLVNHTAWSYCLFRMNLQPINVFPLGFATWVIQLADHNYHPACGVLWTFLFPPVARRTTQRMVNTSRLCEELLLIIWFLSFSSSNVPQYQASASNK